MLLRQIAFLKHMTLAIILTMLIQKRDSGAYNRLNFGMKRYTILLIYFVDLWRLISGLREQTTKTV